MSIASDLLLQSDFDINEITEHKLVTRFKAGTVSEMELQRFVQIWRYVLSAYQRAVIHLLLNRVLKGHQKARVIAMLNDEY